MADYMDGGTGFESNRAIRFSLFRDCSRKQLLDAPTLQCSALYDNRIIFFHGMLPYWYLRITLTTTPWIVTLAPSKMMGAMAGLAG